MASAPVHHIQAVLFDKDGTLIDFADTWGPATNIVIGKLAGPDDALCDALAEAVGFDRANVSFDPASPLIAGAVEDFGPIWAALLGVTPGLEHDTRIDALYREASMGALAPIGDPAAMAEALTAMGLALGIATNDAEANARDHATSLGLADAMGFIAGWDSGFGAKPAPGQILAFAEHVGVAPAAVAMVGDSAHDMDAARAAGAFAIAVETGPGAAAAAARADLAVPSIDALPALFAEGRN